MSLGTSKVHISLHPKYPFAISIQGHLICPLALLPPTTTVVCLNSPRTDLTSAQEEAYMTTVGAVEGLLRKTGLRAQDVDILVTT